MNSKHGVICVHENLNLFFLFAGEPLGGKTAAGIPRGYWSFSWVAEDDLSLVSYSPSGEQDAAAAGPLQIDGQAKAPPSFRDPLLLFPHDTSHPLSINTHGLLRLAHPLFSTLAL